MGLNETHAPGTTKSNSVTSATIVLTDDIRINGVQVGATQLGTAKAKATAINAISDQTGVTASASTTLFLDLDFDRDAASGDFNIMGKM